VIIGSVLTHPTFTTIILKNASLGGDYHEHAILIASKIQCTRTLKTLDLSRNKFDAKDYEILAQAMSENYTVSHLCLNSNPAGNRGVTALANLIFNTNRGCLKKLRLQNNEFTGAGLCALAKSFRHTTKLEYLDIDHNDGIGFDDISIVVESLRMNYSLKTFHHKSSWFSMFSEQASSIKELCSANCYFNKIKKWYLKTEAVPLGLWPIILSRFGRNTVLLYKFLSLYPDVTLAPNASESHLE
jgi:hypothetical protein